MERDELILRRLAAQHLLLPCDTQRVVKDLCGVQAQFLSHALHGLSIRCDQVDTGNLLKSWTNRGTLHLFSADDLPLFLHRGRVRTLRPVDTMETDAYLTAARKAYFADVIAAAIADGIDQREALKVHCAALGMSEAEAKSAFDPWGGLIRVLCEQGRICHKVQEKKAFSLCPPFEPMDKQSAQLELARRYFTHFGPATVKDAAYFFGTTQAQVKAQLSQLPAKETCFEGRVYYHMDDPIPANNMPECLFLAGFDQLLLGYEKTESLILPREHLRSIFNLAGIVRPAVLVHGQVAGWWQLKNRKLTVTCFAPCGHRPIAEKAASQWHDLKSIQFES